LRLLDDAVFCIDCVAAPCIHPGRVRNAACGVIRIGSKNDHRPDKSGRQKA
jgi:hypothetical protein